MATQAARGTGTGPTTAPPPPDNRGTPGAPYEPQTATHLDELTRRVPEIKQMPDVALAIARNAHNIPDPIHLAQGVCFLDQAMDAKRIHYDQELGISPKPEGFWGRLWNQGVLGTWGDAANWVVNDTFGTVTGSANNPITHAFGAGPLHALSDQGVMDAASKGVGLGVKVAENNPETGPSLRATIAAGSAAGGVAAAGAGLAAKSGIGGAAGDVAAIGPNILGFHGAASEVRNVIANGINSAFDFYNCI